MTLTLQNVSKQFAHSNFALHNISLTIHQNEIIGLVGENGTGKSTLLKLMNGLIQPDSGHILYNQQNMTLASEIQKRQLRKKVCYIFQNANLIGHKTVIYHLNLVYKLNNLRPDNEKIDTITKFVGIDTLKKQLCKDLSGGQQQKVAIAMALLSEPEILLCDEISSALDSKSEQEIFDLLSTLKEKQGLSIVMISHNLHLIKQFCDRVLFVRHGTLTEEIIPQKDSKQQQTEDYYTFAKGILKHDFSY